MKGHDCLSGQSSLIDVGTEGETMSLYMLACHVDNLGRQLVSVNKLIRSFHTVMIRNPSAIEGRLCQYSQSAEVYVH